jgi:DNA-binding transcriptional MerR regulator
MYIGKLAALTGATRKAIRHYESIGLIPSPQRRGNYRVYTELDVHIINMIRRAQSVGFSLAELSHLAATKASGGLFPIGIANQLIANKQKQLNLQMQKIITTQQNLVILQEELNQSYGLEKTSENDA